MPSYNGPRSHAQDAREALRRLAHETRTLENPTDIYPVLGDLSNALASLAQSLHQIGEFHEGPARKRAWVTGDARTGRAASYQVAWELHRAAEMVHQVAAGIDRAHEVEATIAYDVRDYPSLVAPPSRSTREPGLSL
jgi:hypothetical protein